MSQTLEIHFELFPYTSDFYLEANFVNQSETSWRLSEIFLHSKDKLNEIVTGGSRWAEIM